MKIWCLSADPQGIQDVGEFVSSVEHKWNFLTQTIAVCQSYNGSQWDSRLWARKKNKHRQNQIKPCGSWRYLEVCAITIALCNKLKSIYIVLYLWSTALSIWEIGGGNVFKSLRSTVKQEEDASRTGCCERARDNWTVRWIRGKKIYKYALSDRLVS